MAYSLQRQVLSLYRKILRTTRTWESSSGRQLQTVEEREYIRKEAQLLFRKNKPLTNEDEIKGCLREASARLELACHYGNPYPRPVNTHHLHVPSVKSSSLQQKQSQQSKPVYIRSQDS